MHDTVEYIANLSSEKLSDFHGLLYRKLGECLGGKSVLHNPNNVQEDNKRAHKKRKKSRREKVDMIPWVNRDEKKATAETNSEVYDDANVCRHTSCPPPHSLEITQACGEKICDVANNLDSLINIDKVPDENYMKLLELENAFSEECYRKAMDFPLSPSLPEIEFHEIFDEDTLMIPSQHKSLPENVLSSRTDLIISPSSDVINVELISSAQKYDDCGVSCNSHVHTENSRTAFPGEDGIGSLNNKLPEFCVVFSNIMDNNIISRILTATKNCIAQCNLSTQTGWAFSNILTALKVEEKLTQKERVSVLLTLMLFNFSITTTKTFGRLWDGKSFQCLRSYYEHICTVMTDAETRILFVENYSLYELLHLIEDFLIEGKIIVNNRVDAETLSSDLRANDFLSCVNEEVSSDAASSEQLVAASIILSSVCAATDYAGFICDASYHILRSCKVDSLMMLTILHIFSYLGGDKFFNKNNFGLMVTVLKSLIMFLEDGSLSVATACLPSINQLHAELCMDVKCPFLEGAESIDAVASLLLEEIKRVHSSESRLMSVQCAIDKPCSEKCLISSPQPDALKTVDCCCLSDVLSLVELVANKMSWHWADMKLVPQLLHILDSCVDENFAIRIIVLVGQLGRNGVDVGGFEDQGVRNLRCYLFAYFSRSYSMKADLSLQFATASALFGLLPLDFETLLHSNINLSAYSISVSDNAEILRKWFSGLGKDQQKLLFDVYNK